jgi:hypothetical protein
MMFGKRQRNETRPTETLLPSVSRNSGSLTLYEITEIRVNATVVSSGTSDESSKISPLSSDGTLTDLLFSTATRECRATTLAEYGNFQQPARP